MVMIMPIKKNKISFEIDLTEKVKKIKPSKRKEVVEEIGIALISEMERYLDDGASPVSGGSYKRKKKDGGISDMYETGAMLGNLTFDAFRDKIVFKITDSKEKKKAYNHNTGDTLPKRQFIPNDSDDEKFKNQNKIISRIINDASED